MALSISIRNANNDDATIATRCMSGMTWETGNLLASPTKIWFAEWDGQESNCQGGINAKADPVPPSVEEWRFSNLQGDGRYLGVLGEAQYGRQDCASSLRSGDTTRRMT